VDSFYSVMFRLIQFLGASRVRAALRSGQLVMTGLQWPRFLYRNLRTNPNNAWEGLFRSKILVLVSGYAKGVDYSDSGGYAGLQTHLCEPKRGEWGKQVNQVWKCSNPQYDERQYCLPCLHRSTGAWRVAPFPLEAD
jgi:hypothetical protein